VCSSDLSGPVSRQCEALNSVGDRCRAWAVLGTAKCWYHGGRATGKQYRVEARVLVGAERLVNTYGGPVEVSPAQALLDEVARTNGHVLWLQEKVLTSDPQQFGEAVWRRAEAGGYTTRQIHEDERDYIPEAYGAVYLDLYMKERQHLLNAADKAIKAGVADRMVRLQESQGVALAMVLARILDALQLTSQQREIAGEVVAIELRSLTKGGSEVASGRR